jgi:hypothetical protein
VRRELEHVEIHGEHEARERAWRVVSTAFAEREPLPAPARRRLVPALALVAVAAVAAATVTSPGRALLHGIRATVGVEKAQPALFSLPAPGRLLVSADRGVWVVQADGSKRRLGSYESASWSPNGLYIVAARPNALYALTPTGDERWSLARPGVFAPRWGGSLTDTRIAYLSGSRLHVVAGDGTGDVDAGGMPAAARVAPGWRPGTRHILAYADTRGRVTAYDADAGSVLFRTGGLPGPRALEWARGGRLLAVTRDGIVLFGPKGQRLASRRLTGVATAALAPDGRRIAVLRRGEILLLDALRPAAVPRRVFAGAGTLAGLAWSPDGRWLLVGWASADQWVFVRTAGRQRIRAVANVSAQFRSQAFPRVEGWCCAG